MQQWEPASFLVNDGNLGSHCNSDLEYHPRGSDSFRVRFTQVPEGGLSLEQCSCTHELLVYFTTKQSHYTPWWRRGKGGIAPTRSWPGTRWGEWSASCPGSALPPGTHCAGGRVGPRAGLDIEVRGKSSCFCRGSNLNRPVVQSAVRHYIMWDFKFSRRRVWSSDLSSGMYCRVK
jgi:hypothetical protein